jgi:hypothetical protein
MGAVGICALLGRRIIEVAVVVAVAEAELRRPRGLPFMGERGGTCAHAVRSGREREQRE